MPICSLGLFTHLVSEYRGSGPRAGEDLKKYQVWDLSHIYIVLLVVV